MNNDPHIVWLQKQWQLPNAAVAAVQALLEVEATGGTASKLEQLPDWGAAAGGPADGTPLVLVESNGSHYLQSRRLYRAEAAVAAKFLQLAGAPGGSAPDPQKLSMLFPGAEPDDLQAKAAGMAVARKLTLITGGPGTGKTYTLARALALLVESGIAADRIRLAAPTGKAAQKMKSAVEESIRGLPAGFEGRKAELAGIRHATLHKLMGYNPDKGSCRYDERNPLPCDVLIIDECSMVDLLLWNAVLSALPEQAQLVLLGDPNQLESVGQGNVFAELARVAVAGHEQLAPAHVHLTVARRYKDRPDIVALAEALAASDAEAAVALLERNCERHDPQGLVWIRFNAPPFSCAKFPQPILAALEKVATAATPWEALEALGKVCILTALRGAFAGAKGASAAIDRYFLGKQGVRNQPVIINRNDPETGLQNGAVGVIHNDAEGQRRAFFSAMTGDRLQEFSVGQLPEYSPAWAITIHRSQGSEYDEVLVILPREESPLATRELLYTAITRAKQTVYVAGELETVRSAAKNASARQTLLEKQLIAECGMRNADRAR